MKLRYISNNKRRYLSLGKEFPNATNELEVDDSLGKLLLMERIGSLPLWEEQKQRRVKVESTEGVI